MPQLCHQLQQLGFADPSKLALCDARDFRLVNPQLPGGLWLRQVAHLDGAGNLACKLRLALQPGPAQAHAMQPNP